MWPFKPKIEVQDVKKPQQVLEEAVDWTKEKIAVLDKPIANEMAFDKKSAEKEVSQDSTRLKEAERDKTEVDETKAKEAADKTDTETSELTLPQTHKDYKILDDGKKHYYDDNGKEYRVNDELLPNNNYELNEYKSTTDENGRVISAEGYLHITEREKRLPIKDSIESIGKGDQREGDDRGHLIGDQFDGSNGMENMIPQDADINRNDYRNFENQLAKEVKEGKSVYVKVEPHYEGDSRRPSDIVVTYTIDGNENIRIFPNDKEAA